MVVVDLALGDAIYLGCSSDGGEQESEKTVAQGREGRSRFARCSAANDRRECRKRRLTGSRSRIGTVWKLVGGSERGAGLTRTASFSVYENRVREDISLCPRCILDGCSRTAKRVVLEQVLCLFITGWNPGSTTDMPAKRRRERRCLGRR